MSTDPTAVDLLKRTEALLSALHGSVARHDNLAANLGCAGCELRDQIRAALPAVSSAAATPPTGQAALRDRIADVLAARFTADGDVSQGMRVIDPDGGDDPEPARRVRPVEAADAIMPVLPPPADRAAAVAEASRKFPLPGRAALITYAATTRTVTADALTPLLDAHEAEVRAAVLREAAAAIEAEQAREEATEWAQQDELDPETEAGGAAVRAMAGLLRRMADEAQQMEDPATLSGRVARAVAEDASALRMDLYDDLAAFARETGNTGLQHAQIRDHLAEFLFEGMLRRLAAEERGAEPPCCSDPTYACNMVDAEGRCGCTRWENSPPLADDPNAAAETRHAALAAVQTEEA